jgi:hypothetical protein
MAAKRRAGRALAADTGGTGRVTFEEVRRWSREQRAANR